jgi:protein-L-isoaspartate(D-aspartate) O-methyltransferase
VEQSGYGLPELLRELKKHGIGDARVLAALRAVPRERFVAEDQREQAYRNAPLPIGEGQTISQPFVVAVMLQELGLDGSERVLEVGTGSGYQTALLAALANRVVSIERHASLAALAEARLNALGYRNVEIRVGDGSVGWPAAAPYDAIVVSAGAPVVPGALLDQLGDGGTLVAPVGSMTGQDLVVVTRHGTKLERQSRGAVRFVPLIGEQGWGGGVSRN